MQKLLFSEYKLGRMTLNNRVVMAPMTRSRAVNNIPNELMVEYYGLRTNAGLLLTEGTSPSPNGLGYARIPGLFNDHHVLAWQKVTKDVHAKGGHIFVQLMHTGRVSHPHNLPDGAKILAPSPIGLKGDVWTDQKQMQPFPVPQEMGLEDIQNAIDEYTNSAKLAIAAGFDGVELHAANGYLIEQFINPAANHRDDQYGGITENRIRFALEIAQKVTEVIGGDRVGIRVSPYGVSNDLLIYDDIDNTYSLLAEKLSKIGLAYIHVADHSSLGAPVVSPSLKKLIRERFKGAYILSGGYDSEKAEQDLIAGNGDLVAFGKLFISNPNLVDKLKQNRELQKSDASTYYTPGEKGYTDYPAN
ncbi:MAG TPA: alkene reductase [Ignavibacteriaceae bacterium]|nr:alkene reductase [Ignavibacteriaceae bacterium]